MGKHKPLSRILLIDDHVAVGTIISAYLTALGWEDGILDISRDVDNAVELIDSHSGYSAILLDHSVPPTYNFRDSLQLLDCTTSETPIILFTGLLPSDFGQKDIDSRITTVLEKDALSPIALQDTLHQVGLER
ncbi:MAG: hypothetical protein CME88_14675 [Hirschia sp.]|nr:hypothetical protein [Hirschia sp.]MBF19619.1 hypothetical protein [Hirschia sp.]|tara:strand:+ start:3029 stop:3427 length:399 start_codon:yes stop_codon:yes gene_type:complete